METIELSKEIIEKYKINPLEEVSEPPTYCFINDKPSLTAGNFSLIIGKKKAGKTFLLGGVVASTVNNSSQISAIKGCLPVDKNQVLYFDTEQSHYHANRTIKRICTLTGNSNPENLHAYNLRPLPPEMRLRFIENIITTTPNVGLVAIDGIRDLLTMGINDEQEATKLTNMFLKWSFDLNLHIILLLHQNKNDNNARGHIGSEVVNKAETIISVSKDDKSNIFKVVCEDSRDISFEDFAFTISDDGLPNAAEMSEIKPKKVTDPFHIKSERHLSILTTLFNTKLEYNYNEFKTAIHDEFSIGRDASEKFINYYVNKNWVTKEKTGRSTIYRFTTGASSFYYYPN
jgi:hypothetical protein